jgi:hypothetical protein
MNADHASYDPDRLAPAVRPRVPLRWGRLVAFVGSGLVAAAAVAGVATLMGMFWAPSLLFPLIVGALLGLALGTLVRFFDFAHRPAVVVVATLLTMGLMVGQHYAHYVRWKNQQAEQRAAWANNPQMLEAAMAFPELATTDKGFGQFLQRTARQGRPWCGMVLKDGSVWASWIADGILTLAAALAILRGVFQGEWCPRCESFYRLARRKIVGIEVAVKIATLCGITPMESQRAACIFHACAEGCVPSSLKIYWLDRQRIDTAWLDEPTRRQVDQWLSEADGETTEQAAPLAGKDSTLS